MSLLLASFDKLCSGGWRPRGVAQGRRSGAVKHRCLVQEVCETPMPVGGARSRFLQRGDTQWTCADCLNAAMNVANLVNRTVNRLCVTLHCSQYPGSSFSGVAPRDSLGVPPVCRPQPMIVEQLAARGDAQLSDWMPDGLTVASPSSLKKHCLSKPRAFIFCHHISMLIAFDCQSHGSSHKCRAGRGICTRPFKLPGR